MSFSKKKKKFREISPNLVQKSKSNVIERQTREATTVKETTAKETPVLLGNWNVSCDHDLRSASRNGARKRVHSNKSGGKDRKALDTD